jgi:hypothetical protein
VGAGIEYSRPVLVRTTAERDAPLRTLFLSRRAESRFFSTPSFLPLLLPLNDDDPWYLHRPREQIKPPRRPVHGELETVANLTGSLVVIAERTNSVHSAWHTNLWWPAIQPDRQLRTPPEDGPETALGRPVGSGRYNTQNRTECRRLCGGSCCLCRRLGHKYSSELDQGCCGVLFD